MFFLVSRTYPRSSNFDYSEGIIYLREHYSRDVKNNEIERKVSVSAI